MYYEKRQDVPQQDRWDLSHLYKTDKAGFLAWEKEFAKTQKELKKLTIYKGKLKTPTTILKAFDHYSATLRVIEKLYVFASHHYSTDLTNSENSSLQKKAEHLYAQFGQTMSYFLPELTKNSADFLNKLVKNPKFQLYKLDLQQIIKNKKHILSDSEEAILAHTAQLSGIPENVFSALDNADLTFDSINNEKGKKVSVTAGNFVNHLESSSPKVRQAAYESVYQAYQKHIHTYSETLSGKVKFHQFYATTKKYKSSLESALSSNQIDTKVYTTLLNETHAGLKTLYKYFEFRRKKAKLKKLNMWDLRFNLFDCKPLKFTFDQAKELCLEALKPLGEEYVQILRKGLEGGWVDKYENKGKRSGAFSGGCYDSPPYILMNFTGTLNDVYTLIHEAGHSMHSYFSRKNQPYNLANYSIFTAEIASTVNERLLTDHLLKTLKGEQRKLVLAYEIDAIRATYYRQTMFAEFELLIHQTAEKHQPLTMDFFCAEYQKLNDLYYGPVIAKDDFIKYEWARIPHFYYNFYVYQYATGIAAAYYFSAKILKSFEQHKSQNTQKISPEADAYLGFLKSGGNDFPLNQLCRAGLDFNSPQTYKAVVKTLQTCLNELQNIL
jgi:oligoendopeptidase F